MSETIPINLPLHEWFNILDDYSIDEIQTLIQNKTFDDTTYRRIKPYLIDRFKNEEGKCLPDSL